MNCSDAFRAHFRLTAVSICFKGLKQSVCYSKTMCYMHTKQSVSLLETLCSAIENKVFNRMNKAFD